MNRIERVVVDECVGQESPTGGQLCEPFGERPVKFVFLATEHPANSISRSSINCWMWFSALLTQYECCTGAPAIGRGFPSFVQYSGISPDRPPSCACIVASEQHLPVASGASRDGHPHQSNPKARSHYGMPVHYLSAHRLKEVSHKAPPYPCPFRLSRQYSGRCAYHRATAHHTGYGRRLRSESGRTRHGIKSLFRQRELFRLIGLSNEPLQATCLGHWYIYFRFSCRAIPLTLYHIDTQRWRGAPP